VLDTGCYTNFETKHKEFVGINGMYIAGISSHALHSKYMCDSHKDTTREQATMR